MPRPAYKPRPCLGCEVELHPTTGRTRRCPPCSHKHRMESQNERRAVVRGGIANAVLCSDCQQVVPRTAPPQTRCKPCQTERRRLAGLVQTRRRRERIAGTEAHRESRRVESRRRRARLRGALCLPYSSKEIYERDSWTCGICHAPIDPLLAYPAHMSPSVDHIVPIYLGGEDTPSNVRATHLICNARRGWRGYITENEVSSVA